MTRFQQALAAIDAANAEDPRRHAGSSENLPYELWYSRELTAWVQRLHPDPSEALLLAARAQHIRRWTIPRDAYPKGLNGYLAWREALKDSHAGQATRILETCGYEAELIGRVNALIRKEQFPGDFDSHALEDALCLMFLQHQFPETVAKTGEDKMIEILRKTWEKMSPAGRNAALALPYSPHEKALLQKANLE